MTMLLSRANEQRVVSACLAATTHIFKFPSLKTGTRNTFQVRSKILTQSDDACYWGFV